MVLLRICIYLTLEKGIEIRSKNSTKLYESLKKKEYAKEDLNVEILPILNSIFKRDRIDTVVCIYSDRLFYSDF